MDFQPAEVRVLAAGSTVAEVGTLGEEGTDEHQGRHYQPPMCERRPG